jgi:DNA-binding phage protein
LAVTRQYKETVAARVGRDPVFRRALLCEGIETMLSGDFDTGKTVLRDYVNATVGWESLGAAIGLSAKTLMRMFGSNGNPQARTLFAVLGFLQKEAHRRMEVRAVQLPRKARRAA